MANSDLKTQKTDKSVEAFLNGIEDAQRREDSFALLRLLREITGEDAHLWGDAIVGFGSYHYTYASGREGDWFMVGFSPRKQNLTLYSMAGFDEYEALLNRLGRHKTGKSCLYLRRLSDADPDVLAELVRRSVAHMRQP